MAKADVDAKLTALETKISSIKATNLEDCVKEDLKNKVLLNEDSFTGSTMVTKNEDGTITFYKATNGLSKSTELPNPDSGIATINLSVKQTDNFSTFVLQFIYMKASGSDKKYYVVKKITEPGEYKIKLDLNYLCQYQEYSFSNKGVLALGSPTSSDALSATINITVCEETYSTEYSTFTGFVNGVSSRLNALEGKNVSNNITGSNGNKYYITVGSNGSLVAKNVIPRKILYIGNSLLLGSKGQFGLCATNKNKDYYAIVNAYIKEANGGTDITTTRAQAWDIERATDESTADTKITTALTGLTADTDLVILQLGDNVPSSNYSLFKTTAGKLIRQILTTAPSCRIAWVGTWYNYAEMRPIISEVCLEYGVTFIDICGLKDREDLQAGIGTVITYADGSTKTVTESGDASHPGDAGFKVIADKIINTLFK